MTASKCRGTQVAVVVCLGAPFNILPPHHHRNTTMPTVIGMTPTWQLACGHTVTSPIMTPGEGRMGIHIFIPNHMECIKCNPHQCLACGRFIDRYNAGHDCQAGDDT